MSPQMRINKDTMQGFPRVSGDEPVMQFTRCQLDKFSPRERG